MHSVKKPSVLAESPLKSTFTISTNSSKHLNLYQERALAPEFYGTDQNSDFIFTIDDEAKGLDIKADSELGLALGVGALCKAAIGKLS